MITSLNEKDEILIAEETEKSEGPFRCPSCFGKTILRKGKIKVHHFAHHTTYNCIRKPETELHMKTKINIYRKMQNIFKDNVFIEYTKFKKFIPDVFININKPFAFEIQHSKLTLKDIESRTEKYMNNNIWCYWIFNIEDLKFKENCKYTLKLNAMQLFTMRLYKGNIYVYDLKKDSIEKWKLSNTFNHSEFYDKNATYQSFSYKNKTIKTIFEKKELWRTKIN